MRFAHPIAVLVAAALLGPGCDQPPEVVAPNQVVQYTDGDVFVPSSPPAVSGADAGTPPFIPGVPRVGDASLPDPDVPCVTAEGCPDAPGDFFFQRCDDNRLVTCWLDSLYRCYAHKTDTTCPTGGSCHPTRGCLAPRDG